MTFCPECGTQLKDAPSPTAPSAEPSPKQESPAETVQQPKSVVPTKVHVHQRGEYGFIRYLVGGLILITVGVSAILELTNPVLSSGEYLAITLLVIGLILILGSVYHALSGRKRVTPRILKTPTEKKPAPPAAP
jgi:hypothetical protein